MHFIHVFVSCAAASGFFFYRMGGFLRENVRLVVSLEREKCGHKDWVQVSTDISLRVLASCIRLRMRWTLLGTSVLRCGSVFQLV